MKKFLILLLFFVWQTPLFAKEILIVEPDQGRAPILSAMADAKQSINLVMYGLTDQHFVNALIAAQKSGKKVAIMLEPHPYKSEDENNFTIRRLQSEHIPLQWPNPIFRLTHEKMLLLDQNKIMILTFNLTHSTFKNERNFALMIDNPEEAKEIKSVFLADQSHQKISVNQPDLLWSPNNSRTKLIELIKSAQEEIRIYAQDLSDYQIIGLLAKSAKKGKTVKILMSNSSPDNENKLNYLRRAGVEIHVSQNLIIHAKVIILDQSLPVLGSLNLTKPSFDDNRELSVITRDPKNIAKLTQTFERDWQQL